MTNQERRARYYAKAKQDPERIEAIRAKERERKRSQLADPEARRQYSERARAWKHGLTAEELLTIRARRRCDICGARKPGGQGYWHIDHDHERDKVRGLLCFSCNARVLPVLEHHGHLIEAARRYLANPPGIYYSPQATA